MTRREEALGLVVQAARVVVEQGSDKRDRARLRDALENLDAIDAAAPPASEHGGGNKACGECGGHGAKGKSTCWACETKEKR